ncbi:MAG TPA: hypothetical protein VKA82_10785 [Rubrobacter sp.]|jgi:hypothetical protein|nr:hypothetical protein [Rubrobacter sp.]
MNTDHIHSGQQAASLEGTNMPNGQKYQDWPKKSKVRAEDG